MAVSACGKGGLAGLNQNEANNNSGPSGPTNTSITRIEISPAVLELVEGASIGVVVTGFDAEGNDETLTTGLVFASSNETVASIDEMGMVLAIGPGEAEVSVKYGDLTASAKVSVPDAKLVELAISPDTVATAIGGSTQLQAFGLLDDGAKIDLSSVTNWKSSDTSVVTVDEQGMTQALAGGEAVVTAEFSGLSAEARFQVSEAKVVGLRLEPDGVTLAPGSSAQLTVTAFLDDGTQADLTQSIKWETSDDKIVTVDAGLLTAVDPGSAAISVQWEDLKASVEVTVTAYELVSIRIEPDTINLEIGDSLPLQAIGVYENQAEVDLTLSVQWSSSDRSVATVANSSGQEGVVSALTPGNTAISASFNNIEGQASITVSEAQLVSLEFASDSVSIREGSTEQLEVYGIYSDMSKREVTALVSWTSDNANVVSVSNAGNDKGTIQGIATGMASITASLDGVSASIAVVVTPPGLMEIVISPDNQTIEEQTRLTYTAQGIYSNGRTEDISTEVMWSVRDPRIATISNIENAEGVLLAQDDGSTLVRASLDGITGEANLTVTAPSLTGIQITPMNPTLNIGDFSGLAATAVYSNGTTRNISRDAQWNSSDSMVVEVNMSRQGAYAEAVNSGTAIVSASFQGQSAESTFTVNNAAVTSLTIDPVIWNVPAGEIRRFSVQAVYSNGTTAEIGWMADWVSSDSAVASVGSGRMDRGVVRALSSGNATITATYQGLQVTSNVTVSAAVVTSVQVTPFMPTMTVGQTQQFQAVAVLSDGTTSNVTRQAAWVSTDTAVAGVSNGWRSGGNVTAVGPGNATLRATFDGVTGETAVTVSNSSIDRIQVTPFVPTVPVGYGLSMRATAIFTDGTTLDITDIASWSVGDSNLAAVSNANGSKGWLTTLNAGATTINVQYMGTTGSTNLTVSAVTLTGITVTPDVATVAPGQNVSFTAIGDFDDGSTFNITWFVTWNSSDLTVADVSNAWWSWGQATGFAPGTTTITATEGTIVGSADLTVQ